MFPSRAGLGHTEQTMLSGGSQQKIAKLAFIGGAMMVVGFMGFVVMAVAGALVRGPGGMIIQVAAGLCVLVFLAGMIMGVVGLMQGLHKVAQDDSKAPVFTSEDVFILTKLILDEKHEAVYDPEMYEPEDLRRYVQVQFANGRKEEFQAPTDVFNSIGEGMRGTITHQGKWISGFQMAVKPEEVQANDRSWGPDPFARRDE